MASTRRRPLATRPPSPGIYICSPPRLHPHPSPAASGGLGVIARHWQGSQQPTCAIDSYSSRCVRRCAAIAGIRASSAMRALGARPLAPRSSVPAGPRSALERVYASPPCPTGTSSVTYPSASQLPSLLACQTRPSAPQPPLSALQRALSAGGVSRARLRACNRLAAAARLVSRVAARLWVLPVRARRGGSGGVQRATCGGRAGERGRAARDCSYERPAANGTPMGATAGPGCHVRWC